MLIDGVTAILLISPDAKAVAPRTWRTKRHASGQRHLVASVGPPAKRHRCGKRWPTLEGLDVERFARELQRLGLTLANLGLSGSGGIRDS